MPQMGQWLASRLQPLEISSYNLFALYVPFLLMQTYFGEPPESPGGGGVALSYPRGGGCWKGRGGSTLVALNARSFYHQFNPRRQTTATDLTPTYLNPDTELGINSRSTGAVQSKKIQSDFTTTHYFLGSFSYRNASSQNPIQHTRSP